jgi:hypothetical protein
MFNFLAMTLPLLTHLLFLSLSLLVVIFTGTILYRNGPLLLAAAFPGQATLARSVNRLLFTGFVLLSLGAISLTMRQPLFLTQPEQVIEVLASRMGSLLLILASLHLTNLLLLFRLRHRARQQSPA